MNSKRLKLIETVFLKLRILKKKYSLRKETKRRGGNAGRYQERIKRIEYIHEEKLKIRDDMILSWGLGEITPPTEEEKMKFYLYYHYLPWSYLLEIKKKYWHGNL